MYSKRISLKNTLNTRSLSNLVNKNGKSIKKHLLIRSDALHSIDSEDCKVLQETYQLKRIIDLRCENEALARPDQELLGVSYILNPILPNERLGVTRKKDDKHDFKDFIEEVHRQGEKNDLEYMCNIYREIITSDFSNQAYANFLNVLLEDVGGATLWHCSAGKDRAGFATILVLYILEFDVDTILEDFLATNIFYQGRVEELVNYYGEAYRNTLSNVFGVHKRYIEVLFSEMEQRYGSIDAYIENGLGFTKEKSKKLRELYLGE